MPMRPDGAHVISTIGDLIDDGYRLNAHCHGRGGNGYPCHHSADIDLEALARRLGRDHSSMAPDLKPFFRCSRCGSKDVGFILSAGSLGVGVSTPSDQPDLTADTKKEPSDP